LADSDRCDWVFVLSPDVEPLLETSLDGLVATMQGTRRPAVILLPWMAPPEWQLRFDGPVRSFACRRATFRTLLARAADRPVEGLCFALMEAILNQRLAVDRLAVRQLPLVAQALLPAASRLASTTLVSTRFACPSESSPMDRGPGASDVSSKGNKDARVKAALIMAHRGRRTHLSTALRYISQAMGPHVRQRVGLDEDDPAAYAHFVSRWPGAHFFRIAPPDAGPYVVRQELAKRSKEPLFIFHDSDDVSCYDRFVAQEAEMRTSGCDLVGCHEMRVDEMEREVTAIRFPLDVTAALRERGGHRLWHPTTMVTREAFWASGGFSTDRKIANDSQFLLRAHFGMKIRNLDGFVYVRRKHSTALTVAPETALDSPIRQQLSKKWLRDFEAIKRGELKLEESSLWPVASTVRHRLYKL
jgi:hypothetical protein